MLDKTISDPAFLAGGLLGGMVVVMISVLICALIYYILFVIATWRIFKKAGEAGWKSLIPIYNTYILYKIAGMKKWFWILLIVSCIVSVITSSMGFDTHNLANNNLAGANLFALFVTIAEAIFAIVISIMYCIRTSRAFGHGAGYAVGLFFLQIIFLMILGFGKSKYDKKLVKSWEK